MKNVADVVANSAAMALFNRLLVIPLLMLAVTYLGSQVAQSLEKVIDLDRRLSVIEIARVESAARTSTRLTDLETAATAARAVDARIQADMAGMASTLNSIGKAVERIERNVDAGRRAGL